MRTVSPRSFSHPAPTQLERSPFSGWAWPRRWGFLPHPSQGVWNLTKGQATIISQLQVQEARLLATVAQGLGVVFLCPQLPRGRLRTPGLTASHPSSLTEQGATWEKGSSVRAANSSPKELPLFETARRFSPQATPLSFQRNS